MISRLGIGQDMARVFLQTTGPTGLKKTQVPNYLLEIGGVGAYHL